MTDSVGQLLATGTQNLAALIGLFSTDSIEVSSWAIHRGCGTVIVSSLSMLGILGLVKSTLKVGLGLERCRTAGFNLDSLRGIYGYAAGESPISGKIVDCDETTVTITEERDIIIHKIKRYYDDVRTPVLLGDSGSPTKFETAINLGNKKAEASQTLWIPVLFAAMCSGVTAWLLLIIKSPWTWVRIVATAGLHSCLMAMAIVPIWYDFQTARPWLHLTKHRWELINGSIEKNSQLHLFQARVNGGDVLHFRGDVSFVTSRTLRAIVFFVPMITSVAYICQYAIVKLATNSEAIVWVSGHAAAALVRIMFWIFAPSVVDTNKSHSEAQFVLINNTASETITFRELICSCKIGQTRVPWKFWEFLQGKTLVDLLEEITNRDAEDVIPTTAPWHVLLTVDFKAIMQNRLQPEDFGFGHDWRLGYWQNEQAGEIIPFALVEVPYSKSVGRDSWVEGSYCWMKASYIRAVNYAGEITNPCTIFAVSGDGDRLHLRPHEKRVNRDCCANCVWNPTTRIDRESPDSCKFLDHRSGLLIEMRKLIDERKLHYYPTNTLGAQVWVRGAGADSAFRELRSTELGAGLKAIGDHIADSRKSVNTTNAPTLSKCCNV